MDAAAIRRLEAAGFCTILVGIGLARFGFPPLIPVLVGDGTLTPAGAGYLAAANFTGYLVGAVTAERVCRALRFRPTMQWALAATVLSFAASALPLGLAWLALWRFVAGATGAWMMVLAPPILLPLVPVALRTRAGGRIFAAPGSGMLTSGLLLALLAGYGSTVLWLALAAFSLVLAVLALLWLPDPGPVVPSAAAGDAAAAPAVRFGLAFWGLTVLYAAMAAGYVPHTVFWVDFLAREAGAGLGAGGAAWTLFGIGAVLGPQVLGRAAGRFGIAPVLRCGALGLTASVLIPLVARDSLVLSATSVFAGACSVGSFSLVAARSNALIAPEGRPRAWAILTILFALMQGAGAFALARLIEVTHTYQSLFLAAALVLSAGLAAELVLSLRDRR
ncbi:YbfB/YjiJ family MFS transporter [Alsobacter sp. R-9]